MNKQYVHITQKPSLYTIYIYMIFSSIYIRSVGTFDRKQNLIKYSIWIFRYDIDTIILYNIFITHEKCILTQIDFQVIESQITTNYK